MLHPKNSIFDCNAYHRSRATEYPRRIASKKHRDSGTTNNINRNHKNYTQTRKNLELRIILQITQTMVS